MKKDNRNRRQPSLTERWAEVDRMDEAEFQAEKAKKAKEKPPEK